MSDANVPTFTIEKLYIKDLSVEAPRAPESFLDETAPQVGIELSTSAKSLDEGYYEVLLNVAVKAESSKGVLFLIELAYGGVFQIRNIPSESLEPLLLVACPAILFPYVREVVSDASVRAGFQPVILAPVNFEALYLQQKQLAHEQEAPASAQLQ